MNAIQATISVRPTVDRMRAEMHNATSSDDRLRWLRVACYSTETGPLVEFNLSIDGSRSYP